MEGTNPLPPHNQGEEDYPYTPQNSAASLNLENEADFEEPAFVDMKDAIEVKVDDDNVPMDEDD